MASNPYAWQNFICWARDVAYPLHAQKLYVHCWGMMNAHEVIRADLTILLILLHVNSSPSGLKPVSETSKIPENCYPQHQYPPSPFIIIIFFIEKDDIMGFGVPLNFLWPCLHCGEQWVVVSGALNVQDAHDFCFKAAHTSGWSVQDLKFTQVFLPSLSPSKLFYMFSESLPILILHLHLLNPRLYPGPCSFFNPIFFPQPSLVRWRSWAEQAAVIWRRICSCFVLSALWWLGLWWFMEKSADFVHQFSW